MENESKKKITVGRLGVVFAICMAMVMTSAVTSVGASLKLDSQTILIPDQMSYSFEFKEPSMKSINVDSSDYTTIIMPGCLVIGKQAGDPAMPVKVIQMLLPPKKTVSHISVIGTPVTVKLGNIDLREKPVLPQQQSVPIGSDQLPEFMINSNIYSTDATFPAARYSDYQVGYSHGYAILSLSLNPVQYNPMQGTLVYYPKMTVTITLKPDGTANQFFSNNPADEAYVETLVSNPDIVNSYENAGLPTFEYPGGLCDPGQNYDYVIITTTQNGLNYWDTSETTPYNWDSLIAEHTGDGLNSTVVTVQDINACADYYNSTPFNDPQAHIREFCRDAYEDWGTRYVLIAGDADTIPARQLYYTYDGNFDSDLYWSNLDNDFNSDHDSQWGESGDSGYDLYSEIYIGRITCDVPQDVSNWLTKSFFYADSSDYEYLDNAGFYGGALGFWGIEGDDFIDYSAIKGTSNFLGTDPDYAGPYPTWLGFQFGFETWNEVNPGNQFNLSKKITDESPNPGWIGGGPSVLMTAINNDQITLISAVAHANPTYSCDIYYTDWESQVHNTKPFFITDYGCSCADFDAVDDGVLESMLFHSDTELAFGCVYNTATGWGQQYCTNSSSAVQQKSFWDYFFDMENNSGDYGNWQLGKGHAWSKDMMAPTINWDPDYQTWRDVIGCSTLFADPAQTLKSPSPSDPPAKPTKPTGQTNGVWNDEYTYTSSTTDPNSDQIFYLFDWDDGSNSGWLGPYSSGETGMGSHIWTVLGTYNVRVKARDVWGAGSSWSDTLVVTITDNNPPNTPDISGAAEGTPGNQYLYNIVTVDPEGQNIYYFVDWGDNTTTGWLGPYVSGTEIHVTHSWAADGNYTIKAKAKDTMDAESAWGTLDVIMPFEVNLINSNQQQFFIELLNQHIIN
jgi:hypothetical protein